MKENTCDKCKFWHEGYCSSDKFVDVSRTIEYKDKENAEDMLQYYDADVYKAFFITGPKFGCIHWSD